MEAIEEIQKTQPKNPGTLVFLPFNLDDLESVKAAAATFQQQESKLDVLWNNAGCGPQRVPAGHRTAQGFESMIGMHLIATLLFTQLLHPQLKAAVAGAASNEPGSVRVTWTSSIAVENTPKNGIEWGLLETSKDGDYNYGRSKVGSWFLGYEMARRWKPDGIVTVIVNPGNVKAHSYDNMGFLVMLVLGPLLHQTKLGAYTELYAGLSRDITLEKTGAYLIPWGRIEPDNDRWRQDIVNEMKGEEEGGHGGAKRLWEWCEKEMKPYR